MRRIFKVSFYIRGNHVNKDGTCAVMIRLSLDGERISAGTTGISIKPELWDGQRQQLKGRNTEVVQTNRSLAEYVMSFWLSPRNWNSREHLHLTV